MMPGESGLELTASISDRGVPVILLTALGEVDDRIAGFEVGADDYLPKPFEPRELVMRLHAILKRTSKPQNSARPFMIGRWRFDPEIEAIQDDEAAETVKLTSVEANLIRALAAHSGEPVSREELARICGIDAGERTIDVQVTRLRRKIEEDTKMPRYLQTIRGKGYLLRIEEL
jgi:two-component system phosphate regulon response regulator OmpR